jgi:hypothetical protein
MTWTRNYISHPLKKENRKSINNTNPSFKITKQSILETLSTQDLLKQKKFYESENKIILEFDTKEYQEKISQISLIEKKMYEETDCLLKKANKLSNNFYIKDTYYKERTIFGFSNIEKFLRIKQIFCKNTLLNNVFLNDFENSFKKFDKKKITTQFEYFENKKKLFLLLLSIHANDNYPLNNKVKEDDEDFIYDEKFLSIFDVEKFFTKFFSPIKYELDHLQKSIFNVDKIDQNESAYHANLSSMEKYVKPFYYEGSLSGFKKRKWEKNITFSEYLKSYDNWEFDEFKTYLIKQSNTGLMFVKKRYFVFYETDFFKKLKLINYNSKIHFNISILKKDYLNKKLNNFKEFNDKILRKIELLLRSKAKQKEKIENVGYVYVLSNEAYPGVYKIGSTYGLVEERAEELTGTGHLHPFVPEFSIKIESAEYFEKTTHSLFKEYRVKQGREFFKMELKIIKTALKQIKTITNEGKIKFKTGELKKKIGL